LQGHHENWEGEREKKGYVCQTRGSFGTCTILGWRGSQDESNDTL